MKFIHAADIHLGCQPDRGYSWSRERSFDILAAFRELILSCKREKPELLLLAGDLFHQQPSLMELKEVNSLFANIPDIPVVMITGNHDCARVGSLLADFPWSPNVHYLSGKELSQVHFPELKVTVHGFSYHTREIREPLYDELTAPEDGNFHILLAHGGDEKHIPINKKRLAESGFSYVALGHIHKGEVNPAGRYAYPGSLSPLDHTETGKHGYICGELLADASDPRGRLTLRQVPLKGRSYISCRIKVTPRTTNQSLFRTLQKFVEQYGSSNIFRLVLEGSRSPEITFDPEYLRTAGRIIALRDESVPAYDLTKLYHEHSRDLIGTYIDSFDPEEADPIRRKAFYYGLNALLANYDAEEGGEA